MSRTAPFPSYNYVVALEGQGAAETPAGGFSDVVGLPTKIQISEFGVGSPSGSDHRKGPGLHSVGDVTLKRGVVESAELWNWLAQVREGGTAAQRDVVLTLRDEAGSAVQNWSLRNAVPTKYTGPVLTGKGSGEIAIEELVLSVERIESSGAS